MGLTVVAEPLERGRFKSGSVAYEAAGTVEAPREGKGVDRLGNGARGARVGRIDMLCPEGYGSWVAGVAVSV